MDIRNPLFQAAIRGDAQTILANATPEDVAEKFSLEEDHGFFFENLTLLMVAAGSPWSNVETVQALLAKGANLQDVSDGPVTAARYAAAGIPAPLLDKSLPRNSTDDWFRCKGNSSILKELLNLGADPNETAKNDRSLLAEACGCGNAESVRVLLTAGANPNPHGNRGPTIDLVGGLLGKQLKREKPDLFEVPTVAPELKSGLYAHALPLHQAAGAGCVECVEALLDAGALPDTRDSNGDNAVTVATSTEVLLLLLGRGATIITKGTLGDAVDKLFDQQSYEVARALLKNGAPLEGSAWGATRAHGLAGTRMDVEALKVFMECGGDIHTPGYNGGTILHTACWQGLYSENSDRPPEITRAMIQFLTEQDIPLDAVDRHGNTALHEAVDGDWENPLALQILLEHGANPDIQNHYGQTPLILAAQTSPESVELLLRHGANTGLVDKSGKTALDHALEAIAARDNRGLLKTWSRHFANRALKKLMPDTDFDAIDDKFLRDAARCAHLIHDATQGQPSSEG